MAANRPKRIVKEIERWGYEEDDISPPSTTKKPRGRGRSSSTSKTIDVVSASSSGPEEEEGEDGAALSPSRPLSFSVNNVSCSFDLGQQLDVLHLAETLYNTEYRNESTVWIKIKDPEETTAHVHKSGKVNVTGSSGEEVARVACRKMARLIQTKGGYPNVKFAKFRINNVNLSVSLPFGVKLADFAQAYTAAEFEPELFPAATYRMTDPKATMHIFHTGRVTVTGVKSATDGEEAVNRLYPMVYEYKKKKAKKSKKPTKSKALHPSDSPYTPYRTKIW